MIRSSRGQGDETVQNWPDSAITWKEFVVRDSNIHWLPAKSWPRVGTHKLPALWTSKVSGGEQWTAVSLNVKRSRGCTLHVISGISTVSRGQPKPASSLAGQENFFSYNLTLDLEPEPSKKLKNGLVGIFPQALGEISTQIREAGIPSGRHEWMKGGIFNTIHKRYFPSGRENEGGKTPTKCM